MHPRADVGMDCTAIQASMAAQTVDLHPGGDVAHACMGGASVGDNQGGVAADERALRESGACMPTADAQAWLFLGVPKYAAVNAGGRAIYYVNRGSLKAAATKSSREIGSRTDDNATCTSSKV